MNNNNKNTFMWVLFIILVILVFFIPKIYNIIEDKRLPKVENKQSEEIETKKEIDEETLESLHYPIMRNSKYSNITYYSNSTFKNSDMSNNDILYTAFLDMYEGNITAYAGTANCTNSPKEFNADYIELRIKNIIGKNINYKLENFNVPSDSVSNFKGTWSYSDASNKYIYQGMCSSNASNISYYDLEQFIKAEYENYDINTYYYVGFAKVEGTNYTIYSDPSMTNVLKTGQNINDIDGLNDVFKTISDKNKQIYKYTFKDSLCSYNEYCLYEGKWIDEI